MPTRALWTYSFKRGQDAVFSALEKSANMRLSYLWEDIARLLLEHSNSVYQLRIEGFKTALRVEGTVASEATKSAIIVWLQNAHVEFHIDDSIVVTAPFRPAADPYRGDPRFGDTPATPTTTESRSEISPPSLLTITRYPAIRSEEQPTTGEKFHFEVDLALERDDSTVGDAVTLTDVDAHWTTLDVDVEVISAHLSFDADGSRNRIKVLRDAASTAAKFEAVVKEDISIDSVDVVALFSYRGRHSGVARRSFKIVQQDKYNIEHSTIKTAADVAAIVLDASAPDLTIKIIGTGRDGDYIWVLDAPRGRGLGLPSRNETVALGASTDIFTSNLLKDCPKLRPGRHSSVLQGIGEQIWAASPNAFRALYKDLRKSLGPNFPIQLVTDEPHIPWEMMFPNDEAGIENPDHLFMTHPMSRWFLNSEGVIPPSFKLGSIASFVPDYTDGSALPAAVEEGQWLVANLGATAMKATYQSLTDFWGPKAPSDPVLVLHFAGHGADGDGGNAKLRLVDEWISCNDVNGRVKLGRSFGTFMVINACEVAASDRQLGLISGWAARLTKHKFGGVLAPLWAVQDEHASNVVRGFLKLFVSGTPLGTAMQNARAAGRHDSSTPYAYMCHGDVMAAVER